MAGSAAELVDRLQEKPRQFNTDERCRTAGRIDDNRSSPSGGAQPLPAAEGVDQLACAPTALAGRVARSTSPSWHPRAARSCLGPRERRAAELVDRLQEKPRQFNTDERCRTAGRIDDNRSSPSGGAQPLPVVEGVVGLIVVVLAKAVLPPDVVPVR